MAELTRKPKTRKGQARLENHLRQAALKIQQSILRTSDAKAGASVVNFNAYQTRCYCGLLD